MPVWWRLAAASASVRNRWTSKSEASCPERICDTLSLIITRDQEEQSYLVVLDAASGRTRWTVDREEPSAWVWLAVVLVFGGIALVNLGKGRRPSEKHETPGDGES